MRRAVGRAAILGGVVTLGAVAWWFAQPRASGLTARERTLLPAASMAGIGVPSKTLEGWVRESAAADEAMPTVTHDELASMLNAVVVTPEDIDAFYTAHRETFGNRSLEVSRDVIDELIRIRTVKSQLRADLAH